MTSDSLKGRRALVTERRAGLDVTSEADWERGIARTLEALGGLDILVNNAGIEISALVVDIDLAHLRRMLDVNAQPKEKLHGHRLEHAPRGQ